MNTTTRTLALTLAAIAGTATIGTATAAATPNCTGRAALNSYTIDIHDSTYTATFTPTPGCDNTAVTIAAHDTAHLTWDPTETQPLIASHTVPASAGRLEWTLPAGIAPRCRLQLDLVTGPALEVVDGSHRYNETAIGGQLNRLIDARYHASPCELAPVTSTTVEPPATSASTTPEPPTTVTRVDPQPPQPGIDTPSTAPVTDVALTPDPTPYTAVPHLPVTGGYAAIKALWGASIIGFGLLVLALRKHVVNRTNTTRRMDSE